MLAEAVRRTAFITDCGRYRYTLERIWDGSKPCALLIMLNPSTADALIDDATIRSCIRLLKALGFGGFEVVNLYALRATDPDELVRVHDPVGHHNEPTIWAAIQRCDTIICAWGAHAMAADRASVVLGLIRELDEVALCFGTTKSGAPKHPLYIKTGTPLQVFRG